MSLWIRPRLWRGGGGPPPGRWPGAKTGAGPPGRPSCRRASGSPPGSVRTSIPTRCGRGREAARPMRMGVRARKAYACSIPPEVSPGRSVLPRSRSPRESTGDSCRGGAGVPAPIQNELLLPQRLEHIFCKLHHTGLICMRAIKDHETSTWRDRPDDPYRQASNPSG